ncbi:MAG: alpha amylase C-terminal domain-containing protein, partial [Mucinivorans sp.]
HHILRSGYGYNLLNDNDNKTMVYEQAGLVFVFNWHPSASIMDYRMPVPMPGRYRIILDTDDIEFGGFGRVDNTIDYFSSTTEGRHYIRIYNTNRSALVFQHVD